MTIRQALLVSVASVGLQALAAAALAADAPPAAGTAPPAGQATTPPAGVGQVIVTAQRKSENLQKVPIAVTALSTKDLKDQRIDNGAALSQAVPNLSFQPGLYGKPNFVLRGIGYQLVTTTGEPGVAVDENDGSISAPRIAEADFFDVSQIEVLRGPQGTLYGRNATGGVINAITAKPTDNYSASLTGEAGNYNTYKGEGYVNLPLGDMFAFRLAGEGLSRDGYITNTFNGHKIDGVKHDSMRATLSFKPNDRFSAYLMWEHYAEDDNGSDNGGNARSICQHDAGPTSIGGVAVTSPVVQQFESLGCADASIYSPSVLTQAPNGVAVFGNRLFNYTILGATGGLVNPGDLYQFEKFPSNPYTADFDLDPYNHVRNDLVQLNMAWKMTDDLTLTSLTTYDKDHGRYGAGGTPTVIPAALFAAIPGAPAPFNGVFSNPQISGDPEPFETSSTYNNLNAEEWNEELRLQSSFTGPINFSIGGLYEHLNKYDDVFIFDNLVTFFTQATNASLGFPLYPQDPKNAQSAYGGHEYFQSLNPYWLRSSAVFGELYWTPTSDITVTGGLRYTDDEKTFFNNSSAGSELVPGFGVSYFAPQKASYKEVTGRLNVEWRPEVSFTDATMFYASYSRGYKGGGFNPPNIIAQPPYAPEFVDAFEVGTKNDLLGHTLTLDLDGFYYNYNGYQFTQQVLFGTATSNVNAHIWGVEFESLYRPVPDMTLNAQIGYLKTEIVNGPNAFSIDELNYTDGNPNFAVMKSLTGACVVNATNFGHLISAIQSGAVPGDILANTFLGPNLCSLATTPPALLGFNLFQGVPAADQAGVPINIAGNRLPYVPDWTITLGGQYVFHLTDEWNLTPRVDFHYQGGEFTDLFNDPNYFVKGYDYANVTVTLDNPGHGFNVQLYVKNIAAKNTITGAIGGSGSAILGNPSAIVLMDPTTYGVSVTKKF